MMPLEKTSEQCLDYYETGAGWIFVIGLTLLGIFYLFSKYNNHKPAATEKGYRISNLKFWSGCWLIASAIMTAWGFYAQKHPELVEFVENCRHRINMIPAEYFLYYAWGISGFFLILILLEFWSIKSKKKNPINNNLSPILLAIAVPIILGTATYIIYYFFRKLT